MWDAEAFVARGRREGWQQVDYLSRPDIWRHADRLGLWMRAGLLWDRCPMWYATRSPWLEPAHRFLRLLQGAQAGAAPVELTAAGLEAALLMRRFADAIRADERENG